jgi:hypothetical protein
MVFTKFVTIISGLNAHISSIDTFLVKRRSDDSSGGGGGGGGGAGGGG